MANADLPDPEQLLADPDSFVLPERSDRAFAALTAVAAVAVARADATSWTDAWKVVAKAAEGAPDVAALVARTLAQLAQTIGTFSEPLDCKPSTDKSTGLASGTD